MSKQLREDLEGVVYVNGKALEAGDTVPDGVELGEHVLAKGRGTHVSKSVAKGDGDTPS